MSAIGKPPYRRGSKKTTEFKVGILDGKPSIQVNWGGRIYGSPLTLIGSGNTTRDSNFSNIRVKGDAIFDSGASVLRIKGDGISIKESNVEIAKFGATTTIKDINLSGKLEITSDSTRNICIGTWSTGDPDVSGVVDNIAIGVDAGNLLESGAIHNTLIGTYAGKLITTGKSNVAIGSNAGAALTTGLGNICIGHTSGAVLATAVQGGIYIGSNTVASGASVANEIVIAGGTIVESTTGKGTNTVLLGDDNATDVYMGEDSQANVHCYGLTLREKLDDNADITDRHQLWVHGGSGLLMFTSEGGTKYTVDVTAA